MKNSLDYYLQAAADSDDSDCDDLLKQKPVFKSRKKSKPNETDSPTSFVGLSQSSSESNSSIPSQQVMSRQPLLTEEQIEAKGTNTHS